MCVLQTRWKHFLGDLLADTPWQDCAHQHSMSLLQGSNESSDDEERQSPYSDGDTDPGITDPGVTEPGLPNVIYVDEDSAHDHSNDPMMSMGSTAFWDPPDLQHPANSSRLLDTAASDVGTGSSTEPSQGGSSASATTVTARPSPVTKRVARVRKRHLGMLQTMLEASRRAAEFVTSVRYHLASLCHTAVSSSSSSSDSTHRSTSSTPCMLLPCSATACMAACMHSCVHSIVKLAL